MQNILQNNGMIDQESGVMNKLLYGQHDTSQEVKRRIKLAIKEVKKEDIKKEIKH